MSILNSNARAKLGEELHSLNGQGTRSIDTLETLRSRLPAMKTAIDDPNNELTKHLTSQEKTAAKAEIDAVIADLVQRIKDFAAAL